MMRADGRPRWGAPEAGDQERHLKNVISSVVLESRSVDDALPALWGPARQLSGAMAIVLARMSVDGASASRPSQTNAEPWQTNAKSVLAPKDAGSWLNIRALRQLALGRPNGAIWPIGPAEIAALGVGSFEVRSGVVWRDVSVARPDMHLVMLVLEGYATPRALTGEARGGRLFFEDLARDIRRLDEREEERTFLFTPSAGGKALKQAVDEVCDDAEARVILIGGEPGTGKTRLAQWIHDHKEVASRPFVEIDCRFFDGPEQLRARLCGRREESPTGPLFDPTGLIGLAGFGTLFIDNLQGLDRAGFDYLVTLLRSGATCRAAGGEVDEPVRCSFILALDSSHISLDDCERISRELAASEIRGRELRIAPLNELKDDEIQWLTERFVATAWHRRRRDGPPPILPAGVGGLLKRTGFSGNLRALRKAVGVLVSRMSRPAQGTGHSAIGRRLRVSREELERVIRPWAEEPGGEPRDGIQRPAEVASIEPIEQVRRRYSRWALEVCGGNKTLAAHRLGISVPTLRRLLEKGS